MSLTEFARNYAELGYPRNVNPWTGRVVVTDVSSSSIIYVDGRFTVEEYFMYPNSVVPLHSHPCDTVTIFLGGGFYGFSIGGSGSGSKRYDASDYGAVGAVLNAGDQHSALIGDEGAVSLIISEWADLSQLNSAAIEWYGEPSGPIHTKLLERRSQQKVAA